jgi:hypothetical protein
VSGGGTGLLVVINAGLRWFTRNDVGAGNWPYFKAPVEDVKYPPDKRLSLRNPHTNRPRLPRSHTRAAEPGDAR